MHSFLLISCGPNFKAKPTKPPVSSSWATTHEGHACNRKKNITKNTSNRDNNYNDPFYLYNQHLNLLSAVVCSTTATFNKIIQTQNQPSNYFQNQQSTSRQNTNQHAKNSVCQLHPHKEPLLQPQVVYTRTSFLSNG